MNRGDKTSAVISGKERRRKIKNELAGQGQKQGCSIIKITLGRPPSSSTTDQNRFFKLTCGLKPNPITETHSRGR